MSDCNYARSIGYAKDGAGLTQDRLREVLDYDPETGVFTWKAKTASQTKIGARAGTVASHGYRLIRIDSKAHYAHRLAWFFIHGYWPVIIDHKNGNKDDNRIDNLRQATKSENAVNHLGHAPGSSGYKGVWPCASGRWAAHVSISGKRKYLGTFCTAEEAARAHDRVKLENLGEFAVLNFPEQVESQA